MIEVGNAKYSGCDSCGGMVDVKIIDIRMDDTEEYDPDGFEPVTFALCAQCRQELAELMMVTRNEEQQTELDELNKDIDVMIEENKAHNRRDTRATIICFVVAFLLTTMGMILGGCVVFT